MKETFYLDKSGHKWINFINGVREKITFYPSFEDEPVSRVATYEAIGNFAVAWVNYKGKKVCLMDDEKDGKDVLVINNDKNRNRKYAFKPLSIL